MWAKAGERQVPGSESIPASQGLSSSWHDSKPRHDHERKFALFNDMNKGRYTASAIGGGYHPWQGSNPVPLGSEPRIVPLRYQGGDHDIEKLTREI
jgi:hypothetical protein